MIANHGASCRKLESMLGYKFRNLNLLKEACTHCSWPDQSSACYQRLEFLGDAVLDILISCFYIISYRCACEYPQLQASQPSLAVLDVLAVGSGDLDMD